MCVCMCVCMCVRVCVCVCACCYLSTELRQVFEASITWNKTACNDGLK